MLNDISKEISNNSIDDPSTLELLENDLQLLELIHDKRYSRVKLRQHTQSNLLSQENNLINLSI